MPKFFAKLVFYRISTKAHSPWKQVVENDHPHFDKAETPPIRNTKSPFAARRHDPRCRWPTSGALRSDEKPAEGGWLSHKKHLFCWNSWSKLWIYFWGLLSLSLCHVSFLKSHPRIYANKRAAQDPWNMKGIHAELFLLTNLADSCSKPNKFLDCLEKRADCWRDWSAADCLEKSQQNQMMPLESDAVPNRQRGAFRNRSFQNLSTWPQLVDLVKAREPNNGWSPSRKLRNCRCVYSTTYHLRSWSPSPN